MLPSLEATLFVDLCPRHNRALLWLCPYGTTAHFCGSVPTAQPQLFPDIRSMGDRAGFDRGQGIPLEWALGPEPNAPAEQALSLPAGSY
ncbi:MAG: hypothetical protein AAGF48_15705, partial [Pseudomonadota bacterium]